MSENASPTPLPIPETAPMRRVFVKNLIVQAEIGLHDHEQGVKQPLHIDIDLSVRTPVDPLAETYEDIVCYEKLTHRVAAILAEGHIKLIETVAERIASMALDHRLVDAVTVRLEKPQALPGEAVAGVEITRKKAH